MYTEYTSDMRIVLSFLVLCGLFVACSSESSYPEYKVAIDRGWYPLNFMGKENAVYGFSTDLLKEVSTLKKLRLVEMKENWDNMTSNLEKGQYDAILSSMQPYLFYEKQYDFSKPYLLIGPVLVLPMGTQATSLATMEGKEVAVISGSADELILEKFPNIVVRQYDFIPDALNALVAGDVDGALVDVIPAQAYVQDLYKGQLKIVGTPLSEKGLRLIAFHGKAPELIEKFNAALEEMKKSGTYNTLAQKWSLPTTP